MGLSILIWTEQLIIYRGGNYKITDNSEQSAGICRLCVYGLHLLQSKQLPLAGN